MNDLSPIVGESQSLPGYHVCNRYNRIHPWPHDGSVTRRIDGCGQGFPHSAELCRGSRLPAHDSIIDLKEKIRMDRDSIDWKGYWAAVPNTFR